MKALVFVLLIGMCSLCFGQSRKNHKDPILDPPGENRFIISLIPSNLNPSIGEIIDVRVKFSTTVDPLTYTGHFLVLTFDPSHLRYLDWQPVNGNYYGTPLGPGFNTLNNVDEWDWKGEHFRQEFPNYNMHDGQIAFLGWICGFEQTGFPECRYGGQGARKTPDTVFKMQFEVLSEQCSQIRLDADFHQFSIETFLQSATKGRLRGHSTRVLTQESPQIQFWKNPELIILNPARIGGPVSDCPPDKTAPTLSVNLSDGDFVSGIITVTAAVSDDSGIEGVGFGVRRLRRRDVKTEPPYEWTWDTTRWIHGSTETVWFVTADNSRFRNTTLKEMTVTIHNP